jgi:uncharacterized damage-inducible protein DinB
MPLISEVQMDRPAVRLANHIKRTVTGPMWHGGALHEVLDGVTHDQAAARPIADAHTIWEIVVHIVVWAEVARARLHGDRLGDLPPREDWPAVTSTSEADWAIVLRRLNESHRELAQDVRQMEEAALDAPVPGLDYTASNLLHGVIEHGTYHGGQIALLKKALAVGGRS